MLGLVSPNNFLIVWQIFSLVNLLLAALNLVAASI